MGKNLNTRNSQNNWFQQFKLDGLYRNRPFYLISRLPKHRALTVSSGRYLRISDKSKDNAHQIFYFDHLTRTVKSKAYTAKSTSIPSKGRNTAFDIQTTNARWW